MNDSNSSNPLGCTPYDPEDFEMGSTFSFWVEGVAQTVVAILGILGNVFASFILSRKEMRNAFNLLLVTMAIFDSTYLFGSILESFRKQFDLASNLHIILFPYLLYPFNQMAIAASIFMTVAIALERFIAVHYPLDYSQAMHEANALTKRIFKYVASVSGLSVLFTITRFFEAKVVWTAAEGNNPWNQTLYYNSSSDGVTEYEDEVPELRATDFRTAPAYTAYFNWSRLIVLGIIPFVMLVYLNTKIYQDIKARRNRRLNHRYQQQKKRMKYGGANAKERKKRRFGFSMITINGRLASSRQQQQADTANGAGRETTAKDQQQNKKEGEVNEEFEETQILNPKAAEVTTIAKPTPATTTVNESRRKKEDNLAAIFMGFIMVFLICHLPRLLLNIHELITIRHAMECANAGYAMFSVWSEMMVSVSHLFLVVNSATNMIIYCCLSSKFREECRKVFK